MFSHAQLSAFLAEYAANNPDVATQRLMTLPQVSRYLMYSCEADKLIWLSGVVTQRPLAILRFLISKEGREAVNFLLDNCKEWMANDDSEHSQPHQ